MSKKFTMMIGDTDLTLEVNKLAPKADVSVMGRIGDTVVLTTVVGGKRETNLGYFPLSVEFVEKLYAGGIIKGSRWVKREGKPTEEAILRGRVIDRSIRPLFPKGYKKDVQVVCTLLSYDGVNSPDMLAGITASAALHLSQIPWAGPVSFTRVGYVSEDGKGEYVVNPTEDVQDYSELDLVVSSTDKKVVMIETQAQQLSEDVVAKGIKLAHEVNVQIVDFIEGMRKEVGKEKEDVPTHDLLEQVKSHLKSKHSEEIGIITEKKAANDDDYSATVDDLVDEVSDQNEDFDKKTIAEAIEELMLDKIRDDIMDHGKRADGRALDEIRPLSADTRLLPRTHGSGLFNRGLTQVLSIATLGSISLSQLIESVEGEETKRYIHHYFSPPYSYGETGRMGWPGRREIGHGALAEKAIEPVLPTEDEFPYTIRVVSEVLSSNGSTSMASTCGSSLALMDSGVPIKAAVGGISIGLMQRSDDDYVLLTDIAGIEDFAGYMDFKVAGTSDGITAIQLDVKNDGLTEKMIDEILERALKGRMHVLEVMNAAIDKPRVEVSEFAPKVTEIQAPPDRLGEIIGPGGKNIKKIIADTKTDINIEDDGSISIAGIEKESVQRAIDAIQNVYREVKEGEVFEGPVSRILPIGAMVEFLPGREGLVHVSKLSNDYVKDPRDVVSEGQVVKVKVLKIDERNRVNLAIDGVDTSGGGNSGQGGRGGYSRGDSGRGGRNNDRRNDRNRNFSRNRDN